ncbi:MAG: trypsin-like peptidase domain-containing protein [Verrucomicrobiota bacterium]
MHDGLRRFLVSAIIFGVAIFGVYALTSNDGKYGLFDLLSGKKNQPETFTAPVESRLDLSKVELLNKLNEETTALIDAVLPSVVSIDTAAEVKVPTVSRGPFGATLFNRRVLQPGQGSGVIVSEEGHIVTNYHVIRRVKQIRVRLHDKRTLPVEVVGYNTHADIAVLKIITGSPETFPALRFADSDNARVGETVFAVGNPFGLSETVTQGMISAKERRFSDNSAELIQTDTVINPGNSGGPLVNVRGDVVGINVAIYSGEQQTGLWQGVGLAIAANDVRDTIDVILKRGRPIYGYLGVTVYDYGDDATDQPISVAAVAAGSPAAKAGLQPGDQITHFDKKKVESFDELIANVRRAPVGRSIPLGIIRDGTRGQLEVTVGEYNQQEIVANALREKEKKAKQSEEMQSDALRLITGTLGLKVRDLTPKEREAVGDGVKVESIQRGSPLLGELAVGDLIHHCAGMEFRNVREFAAILDHHPPGYQVLLFVSRRNPWTGDWRGGLLIAHPRAVE